MDGLIKMGVKIHYTETHLNGPLWLTMDWREENKLCLFKMQTLKLSGRLGTWPGCQTL